MAKVKRIAVKSDGLKGARLLHKGQTWVTHEHTGVLTPQPEGELYRQMKNFPSFVEITVEVPDESTAEVEPEKTPVPAEPADDIDADDIDPASLSWNTLRSYASDLGINTGGLSKDEILDAIQNLKETGDA